MTCVGDKDGKSIEKSCGKDSLFYFWDCTLIPSRRGNGWVNVCM